MLAVMAVAATLAVAVLASMARAQGVVPDADAPGDPVRGRRVVLDRQKGLCLLCHTGPFPQERFQGNLAPDLAGIGDRLGESQLRLRVSDSKRLNPSSIMPSYGRTDGYTRVAPAWAGRPVLEEAEIEDVVAFLLTLKASR